MEGNLLGPFSLLNWINLTSHGVICGKAHDQTSILFISFHFMGVVGDWCAADSAHSHKPRAGNSCSSSHLLPHQCKHCRLFEINVHQLQKFVCLLLALSIPSASTEQNHTLALWRLHTRKSLAGEKKSHPHHERGKLLDELCVLICSAKVSFLPWTPHSTDRSNSFSFSGLRNLLIFSSYSNNFVSDMSK